MTSQKVSDYNLWKFLKEAQFSVSPSQDMLYRTSFAYMVLNEFSNLEDISFETSYCDSPYLFLKATIPDDKKVVIHRGLETFLDVVKGFKLETPIDLSDKRLCGVFLGNPGCSAVIDFNPSQGYSHSSLKGFYGQLESAPNHLIEKYIQSFSSSIVGRELDLE